MGRLLNIVKNGAMLMTLGLGLMGQGLAQSTSYRFLTSADPVQDQVVYLLTLLDRDPTAHKAILADPALSALGRQEAKTLRRTAETCPTSTRCVVETLRLGDAEIASAGDALAHLAAPGGPLNVLVRRHLRPSGRFQRHARLSDGELMRAAWQDAAQGINELYRIYGLGEAPAYPAIDAMSYPADGEAFRAGVMSAVETEVDGLTTETSFFEPWSRVGLDLLLLNQRDEAARYESLALGENRAALRRAAKLAWRRYPYSAIIVPGSGTDDQERGLSAEGALRLRIAVRRYQQGFAPFILVSGGHVHPNKTPYNEALEAKRVLMRQYHLPEDAILADPYARHTTTNLRNAARLLFWAGAPVDHPTLVTTSKSQSGYIEGRAFGERCAVELGYQPLSLLRRLSPHDLVMKLNLLSLHADPRTPLDP